MAVQNPKIPLQSLDDLSESDQYFPILEYGSVHQSLLEVSVLFELSYSSHISVKNQTN